ncbi:alpha/beta fold hydrolase [Paraurantiacibacter namhicola]|uniref:3-oxoadipate enol-lactonase 2 n=1 Tax=Paraurantiacibacter namhicola TaxID=645517 RepID=A0A1C7D7I9_9SPHN|nr:alpha/beta hydrolase [Paraurantiacibacter namhicola]ANU07456.1 3-oxoadipate enol-lactonase 2 [Paraurantiacibacter namhicola]
MPLSGDLQRIALPGGTELEVHVSGPQDAPALLFLHGFPENYRTWRHQIAHLQDRYRCIAPNQRGYGNSSRPVGAANYRLAELVGDVFALAQALGIADFTIVGHDWGGAVAWAASMMGQRSGLVTRAAIANAPHPAVFQHLLYTDPRQRAASQYVTAFRDPAIEAAVRKQGLAELLLSEGVLGRLPPFDPAELAILQDEWGDEDRVRAMLDWYRASPLEIPPVDAPMGLPEGYAPSPFIVPLTIPTLVIWGLKDEALLPANLDLMPEWVEDLRIERVPGAGHFSPWEAPEAVNAALDAFLSKTA